MKQITIQEAAKIMGKSPHFIRLCLRDGTLPFGVAKQSQGNKRWNYYISPKLFYEYVGGSQDERVNDCKS